MKVLSALVSLALAGTAAAQLDSLLPKCAQDCANRFLQGGIGNCGTDPKCICENDSFLGEIACCLVGVCDSADQSSAVAAAATLCSAFSVTDLPTAVSCSTVPAETTTTTGGAAATTGTTTSTGTAATATTGSGSGTSSPTTTGGTSAGAATNAPTTTSQSTNFGPRPTAAAGLGAIGGIMAAVALL